MRRLAFLTLFCLSACGTDFDPPWLITSTRVLGVQSTVVGDATRSAPRPGERVRLNVASFAPDAETPAAYSLLVCLTGGTSFGGLSPCAGAPLAAVESRGAAPSIEVDIPANALETAAQYQLIGIVCERGEVDLDLAGATPEDLLRTSFCTDESDPGEVFFFRSTLAEEEGNRLPEFEDGAVLLNESEWPEGNGTRSCSEGDGRPRVAAAEEIEMGLEGFDDDDREVFRILRGDPVREIVQREALIFSAFATDGDLERQFSAIETDGETGIRVSWTAPDEVPSESLVRFFFAVRDGRGGFSSVQRELCVR